MKRLFITSVIMAMLVSMPVYADNEIKADVSADTHIIKVSGDMGVENAGKRVMVTVLSKGFAEDGMESLTADNIKDNVLGIYMAYTDEEGKYDVSFKADFETGEYTAVLSGPSKSERHSTIFFNPGNVSTVVGELEAARKDKDASKIEEILLVEENLRSLGIGKHTDKIYGIEFADISRSDFEFLANYEEAYKTASAFEAAYREMCAVKAFNGAENAADILPLIKECDDVLNIMSMNAYSVYLSMEDKSQVDEAMLKGSFKTKDDIVTLFCDKTYLGAVKSMENWSEFSDFIKENNDYIGLDLDEYNKLKYSSEADKAVAGKSFATLEAFRKEFYNAVEAQKNAETKGSGAKESSGGSGGGKVSSYTAPVVTPQPPKTFSDIDSVPWAREAIYGLAGRNVLSGKADGLFYPNDIVTREESAKILVEAFGANKENVSCDFTDVDIKSWSYIYVAAAKNAGIVSGYEDGTFGIGKGLKRQELSAMIYRVAKANGIVFEAVAEAEFADADEIAPYAKEAVEALAGAGIINGKGEGIFAPNDYCTRAEAAKIIYSVLKLK